MSIKDMLHVMVVDDNVTSRMLTVEMLQGLGLKNIQLAKDGRDGFTKLNTKPVHIVISDLYMPDVDGMKLLQAVRASAKLSKTGFIMITGRKDAKVVDQARKLGANNVLAKPFTPAVLKSALEAVVGKFA
ncbi:response regulator [Notoacmeibacter ruber]|nr:response regulator [Notoacmeibacter ruber]